MLCLNNLFQRQTKIVLEIVYKTLEEIDLIKESSLLVGKTLANVASFMKPGITTLELDAIANDFIRANGAIPTFYGYREYRFSSCISVNSEIVHGLPSKRVIKEGDIVSVDIGVTKNGWVGDSAYTFMVGEVDDEYENLLSITYDCLYAGIEMAIVGNRVGDISNAVQSLAQKHRYGVVRELVGHGVGKNLHEKPDVPNFGKKGSGPLIHAGLVIAIEPMINAGTKEVKQLRDGWTIVTADNKPSAHFEHTIAVMPEGPPQILSSFEEIEKAVDLNKELTRVVKDRQIKKVN